MCKENKTTNVESDVLYHRLIDAVNDNDIKFIEGYKNSDDFFKSIAINNDTLLHIACQKGNAEMINLLLEKGLGKFINQQNDYGKTPLHYACEHICNFIYTYSDKQTEKKMKELILPLLQAGADRTIEDYEGDSSFHNLQRTGRIESLHPVVEKGNFTDLIVFLEASPNDNPKLNKVFEAIKKIEKEKREQHGGVEPCFTMIAKLWSIYLGININTQDVGCMMAMLKIARHKLGKANLDNFIDATNYMALAGNLLEEEDV